MDRTTFVSQYKIKVHKEHRQGTSKRLDIVLQARIRWYIIRGEDLHWKERDLDEDIQTFEITLCTSEEICN